MNPPFEHCPSCRADEIRFEQQKQLRCLACGFVYFHNVATAVGAVIRCGEHILFAVRSRDPGEGLLDLPGGFSDPGESLEQALGRELMEELGLAIDGARYLCSFPNTYPYRGVTYRTTDVLFEVWLPARPALQPADDVAAIRWLKLQDVVLDEIAFESIRNAITYLQAQAGTSTNDV